MAPRPGSDVNSTDCCANDEYCIVNEDNLTAQCCQLGSTCGGSCDPDQIYSVFPTTRTTSGTAAVETVAACVGRACTSTNYLCPQSMGGECCAYGQDCASSGSCLDYGATSTSSSLLAGPTVATMIPSGCSSQGDSTCSVGGGNLATSTGCCGSGYTCAVIDSRAYCTSVQASSTAGPTPTGSGISVVPQSRGLSAGAKAGIAVGVVVAAALVIGAATWFCIRRRRSGRSTTTGNEMASGVNGAAPSGMGSGGRPHRLAAAGRYESDDGGVRPYGPSSGPHMSEADGYAASSSARGGGPLQGLANDYFGPAAASGPYTTPPEHNYGPRGGGVVGAAPGTSPDYLARPVRGDGATPHEPDDIAPVVEIGSGKGEEAGVFRPRLPSDGASHSEEGSELDGSEISLARRRQQQQQSFRQGAGGSPAVRDSIAGRFELYGTEVPAGAGAADTRAPRPLGTPGSELSASELETPSPMSHEEQHQQQQQQQSNRRAAG